jgi:hypothetical protein
LKIKLNGSHVDVSLFFNKQCSSILLHAVFNTVQDGGQATGYNKEGFPTSTQFNIPTENSAGQHEIHLKWGQHEVIAS